MRNYLAILIALTLVVSNCFIGHFYPPNGIDNTPIIIIITSSIIAFGSRNLKVIWKSILIFTFAILNDILIKLYSGGTHDSEGLEWIHFFLFLGLLPSFGILIFTTLRKKEENKLNKIIAICIFPLLLYVYLYYFGNLGLGKHYQI
jgi:hypothetical protein